MKVEILTLFPEFFDGPLGCTMLGRAIDCGALTLQRTQLRDYATNRHRTVDDNPYGGGAGMVLRSTELAAATTSARERLPGAPVIYLSPQGRPLRQEGVRRLAAMDALILVCGRYEGVDERWIEKHVDVELSIGDFVLSGGEPAALCLVDAIARLLPGVLGNEASADEESFSRPRLEYPQFTRPAEFEGLEVPPVLTSGDHGKVAAWRQALAGLRTLVRRPDLLDAQEREALEAALAQAPDEEAWLWRDRSLDRLPED